MFFKSHACNSLLCVSQWKSKNLPREGKEIECRLPTNQCRLPTNLLFRYSFLFVLYRMAYGWIFWYYVGPRQAAQFVDEGPH